MAEVGSDSPRSIRSYHKGGSGTLTGGGIQKIYSGNAPDLKSYKRKLDSRLGQVLFLVLITMATLLCMYGFIHGEVHDPIYTYVNRTHQIVEAFDDLGGVQVHNDTMDQTDRKLLTRQELEDYSHTLAKTRSTIWHLFIANLILAILLLPLLAIIHFELAEGTYVKLIYRVILIVCLLFLIAQFLYLIYPLLTAALSFPSMIDRLFIEGTPVDQYQRKNIEDSLSCQFETNVHLVEYDLQRPCIPKLKNSVLPPYAVLLMMLIDLFPFAFAVFTYAWSACIKDKRPVQTARRRVDLNNQRRVPIPKTQAREYALHTTHMQNNQLV